MKMAEVHGNRTHQPHVAMRSIGFEDREAHQRSKHFRVASNPKNPRQFTPFTRLRDGTRLRTALQLVEDGPSEDTEHPRLDPLHARLLANA